jgi:hypothetical protein
LNLIISVKVQSFCTHELGSKQHNKAAPTLQNAKCDGRSVWDVMLENEDFKGKRYSSSLTNNSMTLDLKLQKILRIFLNSLIKKSLIVKNT